MRFLENLKKKAKDFCYSLEVKRMIANDKLQEINEDNRGVAVIEIILILVIVLGLIIIFRNNLQELIEEIFKKIKGNGKEIMEPLK